ncbi:hypothetical protein ANCCAN_12495 [Ancylostoma caninum]|uniref:Uncharacterized protein n=1 Tax=Ancylostoma caninum TaxID=29170 RepID=A0A368GEU9_ANCCA|nr:hypothetical protein ANCCAN_12495 [Ancylostoma caninum]
MNEEVTKCPLSSLPSALESEVKDRANSPYHYVEWCTDEEALAMLSRHPFIVFKPKSSAKEGKVGLQVAYQNKVFDLEILNIKGGGVLWRIRGPKFCLGSPTLVPSELLRSSCSGINEEVTKCPLSSLPSALESEVKDRASSPYHYVEWCTDEEALAMLSRHPFIVFKPKSFAKQGKVGLQVAYQNKVFDLEILNIKGGGVLWRIRGPKFCLGFRTLNEMARFYRRFPSTME